MLTMYSSALDPLQGLSTQSSSAGDFVPERSLIAVVQGRCSCGSSCARRSEVLSAVAAWGRMLAFRVGQIEVLCAVDAAAVRAMVPPLRVPAGRILSR